jgi:hypothetical protein
MSSPSQSNVRGCQADSLESASHPMLRSLDLIRRGMEHLRQNGLLRTARKVISFVTRQPKVTVCLPSERPSPCSVPLEQEVLNLKPGELVEVRSLPEIRGTLDGEGKLRGLAFLPNMESFCGTRFRVFKRMETLYQEESGQVRCLKNTVLLNDVQCDGLLMRCDRSCYLYWREAWLKRAEGASIDADPQKPPTDLIQISRTEGPGSRAA